MNYSQNSGHAAVFGGTFNPIHIGHLSVAISAHKQFNLDNILIMPSKDPSSYKDDTQLASIHHRIEMVKLAIKPYPFLSLSTMEIDRKGKTYTADTINELKHTYSNIHFIIGADSLLAIEKWYKPDYILGNCHLIVAGRNNESFEKLKNYSDFLSDKYNAKISFLDMAEIPVSSSKIRTCISNNISVSDMVPDCVEKYIINNKLYKQK